MQALPAPFLTESEHRELRCLHPGWFCETKDLSLSSPLFPYSYKTLLPHLLSFDTHTNAGGMASRTPLRDAPGSGVRSLRSALLPLLSTGNCELLTEHSMKDASSACPERSRRERPLGAEGAVSATPVFPGTSTHFAQTNDLENAASPAFSVRCAHLQKQWGVCLSTPSKISTSTLHFAPVSPRLTDSATQRLFPSSPLTTSHSSLLSWELFFTLDRTSLQLPGLRPFAGTV